MFSSSAELASVPFAIARSMLSLGMFALRAFSMMERSDGELISPFAFFDSAAMRLPSLPHALLLAASAAPFCRLICDHLLCPDMRAFYTRSCPQVYPLEIHHFWRFARCARFFLYGSISVSMYLTVRQIGRAH